MDIVFISPGTFPLPPVDGGAVENLIDTFLKENEIIKEHKITIFSIYSEEAIKESGKYKKCDFKYIKLNSTLDKIKVGARYVINKYYHNYIGNEYITKIIKELKNIKYDILIVENRPEFSLILSKYVEKKIILHLHNNLLNHETKNGNNILNAYNCVLTVSNYISNEVKSIKSTDKVITLYNGINIDLFNKKLYKEEYDNLRSKYKISKGDIVILYVGRLNKNKGIKELMEAFISLEDKKNIKLLIAGSATFGKNIENSFIKSIKELSEKRKIDIIFTGYINYKELPKIYSIVDIAVVPSIGEEASPLTVIEGMATGLPMIVSDKGGIPELVTKECAIIVKSKENFIEGLKKSLQLLIKDKNKREAMGIKAREHAVDFNTKNYYNNFSNLLKFILKSKNI